MQNRTELYIDFSIEKFMEYINSVKKRRIRNNE